MYISLFEAIPEIKSFLIREMPKSALIVSMSSKKYTNMIKYLTDGQCGTIDKIDIDGSSTPDFVGQRVYPIERLLDGHDLQRYDLIFITDVFERISAETAQKALDTLLAFTNQSIFVLVPFISEEPSDENNLERRVYHPTLFRKYDFSYITRPTAYGEIQMYSFFPDKIQNKEPYVIQTIAPTNSPRKLRVGFVLPHKNLTGGMKCLLEQMRQLHRRGHTVYAFCKGEKGDSAIPVWSDLNSKSDLDGQFILSEPKDVVEISNLVDVVVLGFINQISEYANDLQVPIVYWEQGYESLYGDYKQLLDSRSQLLNSLHIIYQMPIHFLAVSEIVSEVLHYKYGIESYLLHNGIDLAAYYPLENKTFSSTVLLVGNPALQFKNFGFALEVLNEAWAQGCRFQVKWACQVQPNVSGLKFPIDYFVMLSQQELAELYRSSDIFLFTSVYESFPMPPMEAMASGVPVIATDSGGILTYAKPGENLLLVDQGDKQSCVAALSFLLSSESARKKLAESGIATANQYRFSNIAPALENYLCTLIGTEDGRSVDD